MKKTLLLSLCLLGIMGVKAQEQEQKSERKINTGARNQVMSNAPTRNPYEGNVGIGTDKPLVRLDVAGYLRVGSSDPAGDANPVPGMIRYNKDTRKFQGYIGGDTPGWKDLH